MKKTTVITTLLLLLSIFFGAVQSNAGDTTPTDVTILENGQYFNGRAFVPFKEMILKDGKIASIETSATTTRGNRIPLHGRYVIPGLTDAHVHIGGCPTYPYAAADPRLNTNSSLLCGVTTLIDLFYDESKCKEIKEATAKSPAFYSTLYMSGPILTAPGGHGTEYGIPTRTMTTVEEARRITTEVIDGGADVIKLAYEADPEPYISSISKEMVKAIVTVAHSRNKKVFAHIDRAAQAVDCAEAGVDVIAHMPGDSLTADQLHKLKASGVIIIPTISVMQSMLQGHDAHYMSDTLLWQTANPAYMESFPHDKINSPIPEERMHKYYPTVKFQENLRNCISSHIPILAGTDAGNYAVFYGYSLHNELLQYTLAGMTNADALCSATQNIDLIFPGIKTGKILPGYDADLVVLDANPLENIENTKKINLVLHKGQPAKNLISGLAKQKGPQFKPLKPVAFDPTVFSISGTGPLPAYVTTYADISMGGTSEIKAEQRKAPTGNYIHLSGHIVKKGRLGFATLGFALSKNELASAVDVSAYSAIEFDARGNNEQYTLLYISSQVKDYNFHAAQFTPAKDWHTIRIPITDLKQSTAFGKQIPLDLKTIQVISFCASGRDYPIDLDLKNIHLVK